MSTPPAASEPAPARPAGSQRTSARITQSSDLGVFGTIAEGIRLSPAMRKGIGVTLVLALVATAGRLIVPLAIQTTTDAGILAEDGVDVGLVMRLCAI